MDRSIVKLDDKSAEKKQERWQKIAKEAARSESEDKKFHMFLSQINFNF